MLRSLSLRRSLHPHHRHLIILSSSSSTTIPRARPDPIRPFCTATAAAATTSSSSSEVRKYLGYAALVLFCGAGTYYSFPFPDNAKHKKAQLFRYAPLPEDLHTVSNWSGTHEVQTRFFHQPESLAQLEGVVQEADAKRARIRPVGSGLSPNGIGLSRVGMVNLALMDRVLEVDKERKTVRVEAGIRVQQLVDGIKEHGLTLQNFASIREQQIGGIVQVGAHGTGARLPPIDEQVISMKLVTPAKGTIEVSKEKDPELFYLARCGLGGLGVVAEVTLQCVDRQELVEHTTVSTMQEIKKNHNPEVKSSNNDEPDINELSFTELRDKLLALDPLNKDHVIKVNQAEAEFRKKSEGYRVGWSDEILGFDCGGQQWVSETCYPAGTLSKPSMKDLEFIEELKRLIEKEDIPAPAPIEQRWTARSKSPMSPASSPAEDDIFSWVGIIMYLPTSDARQRKEITEEFFHYRRLTQKQLWDRYSAYEHWAKIEVPKENEELAALQARLRKRFPVDAYNKARRELDPNKILSNNKLEKLFPPSESP
ncbi:L-galactono-1,4-lactone dehydrogenase, mitochondrial isoform X3 [Syzygium oleosum]|uniref:L-galactono-1,4-lactone dehydrogenase, mitochondrial isoform X3 n=1 Tax=Syzygium oleosum TaxID=219896 RepID=UPI0024BA698B|nr:L-galactono-1,4-lactone dehydrogenase, mitochondrial isoform X3 [Syzygium oleosum]